MDQQNISLMIGLVLLLGSRFLFQYVWQRKNALRMPRKAYPLCCLIVCGSAVAAPFFLGSVIDSIYTLAYAFHLDRETSAMTAKVAVNLMAGVPASLAALLVLRKVLRAAPIRDS